MRPLAAAVIRAPDEESFCRQAAVVRVLVTGSSGKLGVAAVRALKAAGHRVTGFDLKPSSEVRTVIGNCADFGEILGAMAGVDTFGAPDALLHLAGIPMPGLATDQRTFDVNVSSTYNCFSAAARLGIHRIVWASSETILGLPFNAPPEFLPVDESHPDRPEWSYALAKQIGETMADAFVRWHPALSLVSLRFSNVFDAADYSQLGTIQADPRQRRMNLWSYVDAANAGDACVRALETNLNGHTRCIIAAPDTLMREPSAELVSTWFPEVRLASPLPGHQSLLSSTRAGQLLGWTPRSGWR